MNPVPPGVVSGSYPVDGYLYVLMGVALAALIIVLAIFIWSVLSWNRESARLFCPVRLRRIRAVFRLDEEGRRIDVLRCTAFGRKPITCGKMCLYTTSPG